MTALWKQTGWILDPDPDTHGGVGRSGSHGSKRKPSFSGVASLSGYSASGSASAAFSIPKRKKVRARPLLLCYV